MTKLFTSQSKENLIRDELQQNQDICKIVLDILAEDTQNIIIYAQVIPQHTLKICYFEPDILDCNGHQIDLSKLLNVEDST